MKNALVFLPALALSLAACGGNPAGFYSQGQLTATTDTGASYHLFADATQTYRVEATLPSGRTAGITGSCTHSTTSGWSIHLDAVGAPTADLQSVDVSIPADSSNSQGTLGVRIGSATFQGVQTSGAGSSCSFTTNPDGADGLRLTIACAGLTAAGDSRTVSVASDLTLSECDEASTVIR